MLKYVFNHTKKFLAYTVLRHDSEEEIRADNCEDKKCYVRDINYDYKIEIIRSIVDNSQNCRQRVKVDLS